jgi:hypothetical protein
MNGVDMIKAIPWYIFYPVLVSMALLLLAAWRLPVWIASRAERQTKNEAKQIASQEWLVKGVEFGEEGGALKLHTNDAKREELVLSIRPGHPDLPAFKTLQPLNVVRFEFQEESMECALEVDLCGYLRLREARTWA